MAPAHDPTAPYAAWLEDPELGPAGATRADRPPEPRCPGPDDCIGPLLVDGRCEDCPGRADPPPDPEPLLVGRRVRLEPLTIARMGAVRVVAGFDASTEVEKPATAVEAPAQPGRCYPTDPRGLEDDGAAGRSDPPCCARVGSWWCVAPADHEGEHVPGAAERELPTSTWERGRVRPVYGVYGPGNPAPGGLP